MASSSSSYLTNPLGLYSNQQQQHHPHHHQQQQQQESDEEESSGDEEESDVEEDPSPYHGGSSAAAAASSSSSAALHTLPQPRISVVPLGNASDTPFYSKETTDENAMEYNINRFNDKSRAPGYEQTSCLNRSSANMGNYPLNGEVLIDTIKGNGHMIRSASMTKWNKAQVVDGVISDWSKVRFSHLFHTEQIVMDSVSQMREYDMMPRFMGEDTRNTWIVGDDNKIYYITLEMAQIILTYDKTYLRKKSASVNQNNNSCPERSCIKVGLESRSGGVMSFIFPHVYYAHLKALKDAAASTGSSRRRGGTSTLQPVSTQSLIDINSLHAFNKVMEEVLHLVLKTVDTKCRADAKEDNETVSKAFKNWCDRLGEFWVTSRNSREPANTLSDMLGQYHNGKMQGKSVSHTGVVLLKFQARVWAFSSAEGRAILQARYESYVAEEAAPPAKRKRSSMND